VYRCVQVCAVYRCVAGTCVRDTSLMKGQLSSCLTSSTVRRSQADSSWTPWLRPDERRLDEEEEDEEEEEGVRTGRKGLGGGVISAGTEEQSGKLEHLYTHTHTHTHTSCPEYQECLLSRQQLALPPTC